MKAPSQNTPTSALPFLILAALSLFALYDAHNPLDTLRPKQPEREAGQPSGTKGFEIDQRIWDDPFLTGWFHPDLQEDKALEPRSLNLENERALILPVVLPDRLSANSRESRRRRRVALHQALSRSGYRAIESGRLFAHEVNAARVSLEVFEPDYLSQRWYESHFHILGDDAPSVGFFQRREDSHSPAKPYKEIMVVYLRDSDVADQPLKDTISLARQLRCDFYLDAASAVDVRVIGPVTSGHVYRFLENLSRAIEEAKILEDAEVEFKPRENRFLTLLQAIESNQVELEDIQRLPKYVDSGEVMEVYSPTATSDWNTLIGQKTGTSSEVSNIRGFQPKILVPYEIEKALERLGQARAALAKLTGVQYIRTVHQDSAVFNEIVRELHTRQILKGLGDLNKIALIIESDTRYGRSMGVNFLKGMHRYFKSQPTPEEFKDNMSALAIYPYIAGLDGFSQTVERIESGSKPNTNFSDFAVNSRSDWRDPPPHGTHQIDYIRRLAAEIRRDQKEKGKSIRAIGILGVDVYDKLMLMRALQPTLGEVVFFTTDLDARLWHSSEVAFTQNLIIGSSHGLVFEDKIQKSAAPFRDSYQTSLYGSVLAALDVFHSPYEIDGYVPQMFEISTRGPVQLSGGDFLLERLPTPKEPDGETVATPTALFPEDLPSYRLPISLLTGAGFSAMLATLATTWFACQRFTGGGSHSLQETVRSPSFFPFKIFFLFGLSVVAFTLLQLIPWPCRAYIVEPLDRPNGTSAWYSVFFNWFNTVLAGSLGVYIALTRSRATAVALRGTTLYQGFCRQLEDEESKKESPFRPYLIGFIGTLVSTALFGMSVQHVSRFWLWWIGVFVLLIVIAQTVLFFLIYRELGRLIAKRGYPLSTPYLTVGRVFLFPTCIALLLTWLWGIFGGSYNFLPMRGLVFQHYFGFSQLFQFTSMVTLLSYVAHESFTVMTFVFQLSRRDPKSDTIEFDQLGILERPELKDPRAKRLYNANLGVRCVAFTSKLSDIPNRYLLFPFIVLFVWSLGYNSDFDGWTWTQFRWTVALILFSLCLLPSIVMRSAALRLRKRVLEAVEDEQRDTLTAKPMGTEGHPAEDFVATLQSIRKGAYAPILNQPFILAILTPVGGMGSIALLKLALAA